MIAPGGCRIGQAIRVARDRTTTRRPRPMVAWTNVRYGGGPSASAIRVIGPGGLPVTVSGHPDRSPDRPDPPGPGAYELDLRKHRSRCCARRTGVGRPSAPGDARFTVGLADRRVLAMNGDRLEEEGARAPADAPVLVPAHPRAPAGRPAVRRGRSVVRPTGLGRHPDAPDRPLRHARQAKPRHRSMK